MTDKKDILDQGYYCAVCGYFEQDDFEGDKCMACGCSRTVHFKVNIVKITDG